MTWPTPRLLPPDPGCYNAAQQEIHNAIASGPRGSVRGPLAIWLHRPGLANIAQALGEYCRYITSLGPRLSELAILVTARIFASEYEWFAHKTTCSIPDDHIDPRRSALFMARSILREVREGVGAC